MLIPNILKIENVNSFEDRAYTISEFKIAALYLLKGLRNCRNKFLSTVATVTPRDRRFFFLPNKFIFGFSKYEASKNRIPTRFMTVFEAIVAICCVFYEKWTMNSEIFCMPK
jgi:hypothetical protein